MKVVQVWSKGEYNLYFLKANLHTITSNKTLLTYDKWI